MNPWPNVKSKQPVTGQCERCKVNQAETRVDCRPTYPRVYNLCSGCMLRGIEEWVRRIHESDKRVPPKD